MTAPIPTPAELVVMRKRWQGFSVFAGRPTPGRPDHIVEIHPD